ncbi:hypothetical protein EPH95_03065 [Salicibibacter halophilus]|uniref:DUF2802 domain-containing protein n=1 Tax=Salicibibacter halophilus TaxID=2502791 RepID=A0A514LEK0_9BACI|nr:hypothetical protein [Salicibibacter halophilus]QDI90277.1 hypothetical protein EPH95_03065 [Salicibibacter halophilus]
MTTFVITSLLLHVISLAAILYLYQLLNKNAAPGEKIERLLKRYTNEMKEDNEQLLQRLQPLQTKTPKNPFRSELAQASEKLGEQEKGYAPPEPAEGNEARITPAAQVLRLARTGKNKQEIAKALSLGHGEVELLLKNQERR